MAQRHGDALAAHARGDHKVAIEKLKAVAKDAPSAPQVYSSLGMVYEDMLKESRLLFHERKENGDPATTSLEEGPVTNPLESEGSSNDTPFIPNQLLREQCDLAKKAYGSHHVSAILCKKDFTLWVRAGDSALTIAEVHGELLSIPGLSEELFVLHKAEKRRWQDEALRDILMADNLKPPGIDVPAKLAAVHLDLGNLSECLTILTDLKNRSGMEFHSSYKAWLLYSDLMLRLGHECIQWNQGLQTNENYMVRRWLRKYSKSFDWQERRVQALALALETAAGTKSTQEFVIWLRLRTEEKDKNGKGNNEDGSQTNDDKGNKTRTENLAARPSDSNFEEERGILARKQEKEVNEFDKNTADMELVPDSDPSRDREAARESLLESHKLAMGTLEGEFGQGDKPVSGGADEPAYKVETGGNAFPISGSVRVTCFIASDLMKHLHGLQLYKGARLVGEAVAKYMKERARRADRAKSAKQRADAWQEKVDNSPFFLDAYDEEASGGDDDDDNIPYLSDEETLIDVGDESSLVETLRRGVLPPELRVLLALAMIGEGGRNFVASKYLDAIHLLDQESETWIADGDKETLLSGEPRWFLFNRAMREDVSKTIAFAFLADVLKKTEKEAEWAVHLSPMFLRHVKTLEEIGIIDHLVAANANKMTANGSIRKNQVLKVILASCRLGMETVCEREEVVLVLGNKRPEMHNADRLDLAQNILEQLVQLIPLMWRVDRTGVLSRDCIEIVVLSSRCIRWLSSNLGKISEASLAQKIFEDVKVVVSYFVGGNPIPDLEGLGHADGMKSLLEATRYPLSKLWQPLEFRPLSDRTYNIAASCNVPSFSGWENEKFSARLLRRRFRDSYYWLHVQAKRITGCLTEMFEKEIKEQFDIFEELEPDLPKSNFEKKLELVKESDWFKGLIENVDGGPDISTIAAYGEDDMLLLFLAFSRLSLQLAGREKDRGIARRHEQLALSVLLPLCQFCLDESLWDFSSATKFTSQIPERRAKMIENNEETRERETTEYEIWRREADETIFEPILQELQPNWDNNDARVLDGPGAIAAETLPALDAPGTKRSPTVNKPVSKKPERKNVVDTSTLRKIVLIPVFTLNKLWKGTMAFQPCPTHHAMSEARLQMKKVHNLMCDLRTCFTMSASEKCCLALSVALLDLASASACQDPFLCLQQAAMYASHASKAGNSDLTFRHGIPEGRDCTPLEALVILGRADCLNSVYFPREAAFLCSFVARACALRRNAMNTEHDWSDQWKLVGVYAHTVHIMIRTTVQCMIDHSNHSRQTDFSSMWGKSVKKELENGAKDASELLQTTALAVGEEYVRFEEDIHDRYGLIEPDDEIPGHSRGERSAFLGDVLQSSGRTCEPEHREQISKSSLHDSTGVPGDMNDHTDIVAV